MALTASCLMPCAAETDAKRLQPAQAEILPPLEPFRLQAEIGEPAQQGAEGDLPLQPRQGRPEAEMRRPAECEVPIIRPGQVEAVRVGEPRRDFGSPQPSPQ